MTERSKARCFLILLCP